MKSARAIDLVDEEDSRPVPLPLHEEEAKPEAATPVPYVAWFVPTDGAPRRVPIDAASSKQEAIEIALVAGGILFPRRGFSVTVFPSL